MRWAPARPVARAQFTLSVPGAARHHQHQRHGEISRAFGQHVRRVGDCNAMSLGLFNVDMGVTHAVVCQDLGLRARHVQRVRPKLVRDCWQDRIKLLDRLAKLCRVQRAVAAVQFHIVICGQLFLDRFGPPAGDKYAWLDHHAASITLAIVSPITAGFSATVTPAADRISTFSDALSPNADMIAPACPIVRPFGAVRPAT